VGRDESAGKGDRLSQSGTGVACHPLEGPPKKNHCRDDEGDQEKSRTKENQENQKLT